MRKVLSSLLVPVLFLCAASGAESAQEVRLWHGMSGAQGAELDRLVARYNASQRSYRVLSYFRGPYDDVMAHDIKLRKGTQRAPHLVQVQDAAIADIVRSGAARPLWQFVAAAKAPYFAVVSAPVSDERGRLLALPFTGATPVLYYNRDAFRNANLDPAGPPQTWSDMPAALAALVEAGQGCGLTTAWQSWVLIENMNAWHNQRFADGGRLAFNNRLMVRWVATLASWQKAGYFSYSGRKDEAEARFASGECAMLTSSSAAYAELRRRAGFDFAVAQFPYYDDFQDAPHNTLIGGSALWALAGKSPPEYRGVASFFAFLARPDVQAEWHQRTGNVPLSAAAYDLTRKQGFYDSHPGHEIAARQLLGKRSDDAATRRLRGLRMIRGIIDEELEAVWNQGKAPLDALNAAVRRGNVLLETAR